MTTATINTLQAIVTLARIGLKLPPVLRIVGQ